METATINKATYDAFIEAGASEEKATAAAAAIPESGQVATQTDIARLEGKIADLRADIYRAIWLQSAAIIGIMIALKIFD